LSTFVVGDVQGCYEELRRLLEQVAFDRHSDQLWLTGDLVNRGPQSLEVLKYLYQLDEKSSITCVLGNHDIHLLRCAYGVGEPKPSDTLEKIFHHKACHQLIRWLGKFPLCHVRDGYALVHAGLLSDWDISLALSLSEEVSAYIRGYHGERVRKKFFHHLWGTKPVRWENTLTGWDRLRIITNAMTRMRYCLSDGSIVLHGRSAKLGLQQRPASSRPWFAMPHRKNISHTVLFGHWSTLGLYNALSTENVIGLDTGCLWGGQLTAIRLEDHQIFQTDAINPIQPDADS